MTTLDHVPQFARVPAMRCFYRPGNSSFQVCGELAAVQRAGNGLFETEFFCQAHAGPSDVPIANVVVFRRVRLVLDVYLAAAHEHIPIAQAEALARVETAVQAAGGVLEVQAIHTTVGKSSPPPPPGPLADVKLRG